MANRQPRWLALPPRSCPAPARRPAVGQAGRGGRSGRMAAAAAVGVGAGENTIWVEAKKYNFEINAFGFQSKLHHLLAV